MTYRGKFHGKRLGISKKNDVNMTSWRTHILFKLMGIMAWLGGINQLPKSGQINLVWLINISYHLPKKLHGAVHQMTSTVYCQICCDIRSSGDILRQAQNDTDPKQQQTAFKHHNRKIGELSRTVISLMDNAYINTLRPRQNGQNTMPYDGLALIWYTLY